MQATSHSAKLKICIFAYPPLWLKIFGCFELDFQFLNVEKDEKSDCQLDKISTEKINPRFLHLSEQDENPLLADAEAKATKSSTPWAVKVFKGMKERRKTDYFVTNERNRCELKYMTNLM